MARFLLFIITVLFSNVILAQSTPLNITGVADVYSNVQKCLSGQGGGTNSAQSKSSCIQSAIDAEETNQQQKLYQIYINYVAAALNPQGGGGGGGGTPLGGGTQQGVATPSRQVIQTPAPTQAPPTAPAQAPKTGGGLQYY